MYKFYPFVLYSRRNQTSVRYAQLVGPMIVRKDSCFYLASTTNNHSEMVVDVITGVNKHDSRWKEGRNKNFCSLLRATQKIKGQDRA